MTDFDLFSTDFDTMIDTCETADPNECVEFSLEGECGCTHECTCEIERFEERFNNSFQQLKD